MIRRRTITSYVWNSVSGNKMVILSNCIRNFFRKFELIGNSTQGENPAPDNPQEIKSAGRKSRNLFDAKKAKSGWITSDGKQTLVTLGSTDNVVSDYIQVYPGMNYTSSASVYQNFYDSEKNFLNHNPNTSTSIVVPDNAKYMIVVVAVNRALVIQTANSLMINIGSSALPYEQYTDKYLLDVKVTGKNLLSNKSADWQIGKRISWSGYPEGAITIYPVIKNAVNVISLKPLTAYSIINNSGGIVINRIVERGLNKNGIKDHDVRSSKYTFVTNQNTMNAILQFEKVDGTELLSSDIESIKIMLVEGEADENAPYEPYTEQSVQIALGEPLRGIGEYKDTITKDGVVRRIKRIVLDGSENWVIHKEKETTVSFWTNSFKFLFPTHNTMLVDKFAYVISGMNKEDVSWSVYGSNFFININKDIASNLESFKIWLSKNTVTVEYIAIETTTEPLPESVQQQLQALHSENGTTHVFVDSGKVECGINIEYKYKS